MTFKEIAAELGQKAKTAKIQAILKMFAEADCVTFDDSGKITKPYLSEPIGDDDHEVVYVSSIDSRLYTNKLTEGGLAQAIVHKNSLVIPDHEGDKVFVTFFCMTVMPIEKFPSMD